MSLSPIFSINKDLLVVVSGGGSEFVGSKFKDVWRDVGATRLLSPTEVFLLLDNDETLTFSADDRDAEIRVVFEVGFDNLGVEVCGDLGNGDTGFFFFGAVKFCSFSVEVI